ncbi:MAG TPA: membrane protein insertase YidC [Stellaceae bacterium]|nr:membrane protein insertase YidC [Stellaceae bacterium]
MDQQKNYIIAIVLSVAILLGFQFFVDTPRHRTPPADNQAQNQLTAPTKPAEAPPTAEIKTLPRAEALASAPRVTIDTPRLHGSIDLMGAKIDDLALVDYHETTSPSSPEIVLLSPEGSEHPYFAEFDWSSSQPVPGPETRWSVADTNSTLTPDHPVTLTWNNGQGLVFERRFAIDSAYMFTLTDTVRNEGAAAALTPTAMVERVGTPPTSGTYLLHEGPLGIIDGFLQEHKYSSLKVGEPVDGTTTGGWLGITDKYWLTALIPDQKEAASVRFVHEKSDSTDLYRTLWRGSDHALPAGGTFTHEQHIFAGAKEVDLLDHYEETLGIPRFDRAIDFGWFYWLTKPIFLTLVFFHHLLGNFGLAILLLTVIIKLVFFPLANKSYRAMSKMKLLQPEMAKLRELYGEDKAKLNQEMMALYKRVGANPMAGCLPMVIQIPVFFSLYKVLYVTIEMRHAPFYGWIHDLSAPDPTSFANLFGLIPFTPPSLLMIGAWPLIMGATMFLQQKLSPQMADPVQARMFMFLPLIFTYMLAQFPAGLVIYWAWNNLLSITQQWVIMRRAAPAVAA